jgi:hypothetical protein
MCSPNSRKTPIGPRTRRAIVGAIIGLVLFIAVFSVSDLEMGIGRAELSPIHVLFAVAVVVLFAYLLGRKRRSDSAEGRLPTPPQTQSPSNSVAWLAVAALIGGPILTFAVGLVWVVVFNVHSMDRTSLIGSLTTLGFIVGTLVAVALAMAGKNK